VPGVPPAEALGVTSTDLPGVATANVPGVTPANVPGVTPADVSGVATPASADTGAPDPPRRDLPAAPEPRPAPFEDRGRPGPGDDRPARAEDRPGRAEDRPVRGEERESERGLRGLVGSGSSQVGVGAALRARDAARPTERHLADADHNLVIVRRNWMPREDLPRR
jgi:hypothetical protein